MFRPSKEEILSSLRRTQRPRLGQLVRAINASDKANISKACDLLIELFATLKATLLAEPRLRNEKYEVEAILRNDYSLLGSRNTFTGYMLRVGKTSGEQLAVKVCLQDIVRTILDYTEVAVQILSMEPLDNTLKAVLSEELIVMISNEVDLEREAVYLDLAHATASQMPGIIVPRLIDKRISSQALVMEWVSGKSMQPWDLVPSSTKSDILRRVLQFNFALLAQHAFFRYDNHWSNLKIAPGNRLAILDYGSVMELAGTEVRSSIVETEDKQEILTSRNIRRHVLRWVETYLTELSGPLRFPHLG